VARDWRKQGLKPHRIERYMATNDPCLEAEPAENIGPCRNKPAHAAVFCVSENTATQAVVTEQFGGLPIMGRVRDEEHRRQGDRDVTAG